MIPSLGGLVKERRSLLVLMVMVVKVEWIVGLSLVARRGRVVCFCIFQRLYLWGKY